MQISVADTGRGIPPRVSASTLQEFVQVPDAATGTAGLGLAISKRIINAHGGTISVESDAGRGATFTFSCPWQAANPISPGETRT